MTQSEVKLSDGLVLPKGTLTAVSAHCMWDPEIHEQPEVWDGARFFKKRQLGGHEKLSQLVATSTEHIAFGHGAHACPGRFFAANEIKVALVHILMKYDVKLLEEQNPKVRYFAFAMTVDPSLKLMVRRRESAVDQTSF